MALVKVSFGERGSAFGIFQKSYEKMPTTSTMLRKTLYHSTVTLDQSHYVNQLVCVVRGVLVFVAKTKS